METNLVQTEISKRVDGNFNVWAYLKQKPLLNDTESPTIVNWDGKEYHPRIWTVVGVAPNAKEAKGIQTKYRYLNL